ncbi:MAG: Hint domain-containing protein, partial [Pseudomonadota bacterium]
MWSIEMHQSAIPFGADSASTDFTHNYWVLRDGNGFVAAEMHGHPTVNGVAFGSPQSNDQINIHLLTRDNQTGQNNFFDEAVSNVHGIGFWSEHPSNQSRPFEVTFQGSAADVQARWAAAAAQINIVNNQQFDYELIGVFSPGQNSNSVAFSIGRSMGFDPLLLPLQENGELTNSPGWGRDLIEQSIEAIDDRISGLNPDDPSYDSNLIELLSEKAVLENEFYNNRTTTSGNITIDIGNGPVTLPRHQAINILEDGGCFLPGTKISEWGGSSKPIEEVEIGDQVTSYDPHGNLVPGKVTRVFRNRVKHVLDVFGLHVTPGHVTLCGDGPFAGRHVP